MFTQLNVSTDDEGIGETKSRKDKLDVSVGVGEKISLTCLVMPEAARRLMVNVSWTYPDVKAVYQNLVEGQKQLDPEPFTLTSGSISAHTLVFRQIERKHRGEYTCSASVAGVGLLPFAANVPSKVLIRVKGVSAFRFSSHSSRWPRISFRWHFVCIRVMRELTVL